MLVKATGFAEGDGQDHSGITARRTIIRAVTPPAPPAAKIRNHASTESSTYPLNGVRYHFFF